MLFLVRGWCRIKRLKRLLCLVFLALFLIYLFHFVKLVPLLSLSDDILYDLHEKVTEGGFTEGVNNNSLCTDYFHSLFLRDKQWKIKYFDQRKWFFSKKQIISSVRHLRIYGHCFIRNSAPLGNLDIKEVERRLFPIFTQKLPIFSKWDGLSVHGFPVLDKISGSEITNLDTGTALQPSFWSHVTETINGRGIVISVGPGGVDEVKRLLKILRTLHSTLPIQIVHKGDMSISSIQDIIDTGRNNINIEVEGQLHELEYPQEIWFVNAKRSIENEGLDLFNRFSNKWIASLFNSFEEMILMDSDAVPFVRPEVLFDVLEYRETGAYFFKDRPIAEFMKSSELRFFNQLLPVEEEYSTFEIPRLTEFTTQNDFLKSGYKHLMESGIVVMKRGSHFPGLLISTAMQLWKETSEPIYGDKELFWLGQSISGNEEYRFNKNAAGALGIFSNDEASAVKKICSTQLAHFSEDLHLLWTNGGLRNCKKPSWQIDFAKNKPLRQKYKSVMNLKNYYDSPIKANGAIIPPRYKLSFIQRLKGTNIGFQKCPRMGCNGYVWCAYDNPAGINGNSIRFTVTEINKVNFMVKVWNSN